MLNLLLVAALVGVGGTVAIDLWSLVLKRGFGLASLNYCMLGRWFLHMPNGRFVHSSIGAASPKAGECPVGWLAHYSIGISLSLLFVALASPTWLVQPTLLPALAFGIATVLIPFFVLQPSLGLGIASAKTPNPTQARLKSLSTHTVFGLGLYLTALGLARWLAS